MYVFAIISLGYVLSVIVGYIIIFIDVDRVSKSISNSLDCETSLLQIQVLI